MTTKEAFNLVSTIEDAKKQIEKLEFGFQDKTCSNCYYGNPTGNNDGYMLDCTYDHHFMTLKYGRIPEDFGCNKFRGI